MDGALNASVGDGDTQSIYKRPMDVKSNRGQELVISQEQAPFRRCLPTFGS